MCKGYEECGQNIKYIIKCAKERALSYCVRCPAYQVGRNGTLQREIISGCSTGWFLERRVKKNSLSGSTVV